MALATQCPHCGKRFRVAADQLKLRGGIVRCGACHEVFDGNATLIDLDALAAKQAAAAASSVVPSVRERLPAQAGTHTEPAEVTTASPPEAPTVVPAQAGTQVPEHATAPDVVPAQAGTHTEPAEVTTASPTEAPGDESEHAATAPTVVPAQAGTHTPPAATIAPEEQADVPANDAPAPATAPAEPAHEPIYTLDFDHTFDPFGILPKPAAEDDDAPAQVADHAHAETGQPPEPEAPVQPEPPAAESAPDQPEPAAPAPDFTDTRRIEPTLGLPVDEELVAAALPGHDDFGPHDTTAPNPAPQAGGSPLLMRASAPAEPSPAQARPARRPKPAEARAARRSKLTPTKIAPPKLRAPEIDEPEFVRRSRQHEQSGKTRRLLLAAGSIVLLLALAGQSAFTFRDVLAARYPGAKPALASACALLRCRVELPAQIDNLAIEQGELTALGANTYSLATLLHNQGSLVQAWPHIELALLDPNDKPLVRRVFTPAEFLPQGVPPAAGFAARAEQPVRLTFQLDQLKPSGYRIAIFYP